MNLDPNTSLTLMQATQGGANNAINATKNASLKTKEDEKINAVAKDFEAMFVTEMMKPMFEQIKPNKMFGGGKGEEIFSGMMLQEYGKLMAETGQLGISDSLKKELIRMQGDELDTAQDNKPQTKDVLTTIIDNASQSEE